MRVTLEIVSGVHAGRKFELAAGQTLRVGRTAVKADFATEDTYMSGEHFALECAGAVCRLRDLESRNGTFVNDERVPTATLRDGDRISAGHMTFLVRIDAARAPDGRAATRARSAAPKATRRLAKPQSSAPPANSRPVAGEQTMDGAPPSAGTPAPAPPDILECLKSQETTLFALLDAARDPQVLALLSSSTAEHQSLYEGRQGEDLAAYAPYLVRLPAESALLEQLTRAGWGRSWGVYLTSDRPFDKLRRYLRQFLMVKLADGREAYFRFYDPRVLRLYLPTCAPAEVERFFGAVTSFLLEAEQPAALLKFTPGPAGVEQETLLLSVPAPDANAQPSADAQL